METCKMRKIKSIFILFALAILAVQSCKKQQEVFEDPYADAKEGLGISLSLNVAPEPSTALPGTVITFKAAGLLKYKDKIKFMFNGEEGQIQEVTETEIKVKVPDAGSSGITSIAVEDQLILGPQFTVRGLINKDPSFKPTAGTNGLVNQVYDLDDGRELIIGDFTNYDNKGIGNLVPLNRIVRTSSDGELDRTFRAGKGANGQLSRVIEIGGKFIIAGGFSGYNQRTSNISNITALNRDGSIDTTGILTFQKSPLMDTLKYYPKFNGGTTDYINGLYPHQGKILATGNFRYYVNRSYGRPNYDFTKDSVRLDSTEIRQLLRFNLNGSLDSTFRFDIATHKGLLGANGSVASIVHKDPDNFDKIVIYGDFNTFDGAPVGRLVRLNPNGSIDNTFQTGSGADNAIYSLNYNSITKKYLITGAFTKYNGKDAVGLAVLNQDGTLDQSFVVKNFEGGVPFFAKQLNDGLIVVSGDFQKYNNVTRSAFMVLKPDGSFAPGYNSTGPFSGFLRDVIETKSADGKRALLLIGAISRFDNEIEHNILRVTIE